MCGKIFKSEKGLNLHQLQYQEIYKFKCNICKKGYNVKAAFQAHLKMHVDSKTFKCKRCGVPSPKKTHSGTTTRQLIKEDFTYAVHVISHSSTGHPLPTTEARTTQPKHDWRLFHSFTLRHVLLNLDGKAMIRNQHNQIPHPAPNIKWERNATIKTALSKTAYW